MAKYSDFKSYIGANYGDYLKQEILHYIEKNHDGQGFHSINVLSLCKQEVDNQKIRSLKCNNMPDPFVKIDVNVTADIVMFGLGTKRYEADRKTRWFTIHLVVNLREGMVIIKDKTRTEEFAPGAFDKTTALDEYMVPYIYTADLEDMADDFTLFYCQDAIYHAYEFPYGYVMNALEINAYEADLPEKTMGRMYFREDTATIYTSFHPNYSKKKTENAPIHPGTMLISRDNYFMHQTGSANLTIAHEIIHWYCHQKFFKILALLDDGESNMACDVEPPKYDENMTGLQKAKWFVEWQANALGMRIPMPRELFCKAMQEAYATASQAPKMKSYRAEVLENTIHRVAQMFGVSNIAAKQRAIQLGLDTAAGTHIYIDGHYHLPFTFEEGVLQPKQSFIIDRVGLDELCKKNKRIADLLDSKRFIYLGYVVCINDAQYVRKVTDDSEKWTGYEYELSDYAREHVDECCLIFDWKSISGVNDDGGFYGQCYLSKDVSVDNRIEHYYNASFENNQTTESLAEAIKKYKEIFIAEDKVLSELPGEFPETLIYHMDRKKITVEKLSSRSGLSSTTLKKYRAGRSKPDIDNVMALFIGLNLPEKYCDHILDTLEISLKDKNPKQKVYRILIREHSDGTLEQWNTILDGFGLSPIPNTRNQTLAS